MILEKIIKYDEDWYPDWRGDFAKPYFSGIPNIFKDTRSNKRKPYMVMKKKYKTLEEAKNAINYKIV